MQIVYLMKKTLNINLAGYPFTIDEDAYDMLKDYIDTIRYAFDTPYDTGEIANDIESRIAELLIERNVGKFHIVTIIDISEVIERIGKPSEFIELDVLNYENDFNASFFKNNDLDDKKEKEGKKETSNERKENEKKTVGTPPPFSPQDFGSCFRKKLFRNPGDSILGGVCSGLALYLNLNVTLVRFITILLFFITGTIVAVVYIILWIVVPEARTPLQRMQMMGENPTMENIGKTITGNFQDKQQQRISDSHIKGNKGLIYQSFDIVVKCLIILGLVIVIPIMFALCIGLLGCVIAAFIIGITVFGGISEPVYSIFNSSQEGLMVFYILLAVIGGIITLGVPLWLCLLKLWNRKKPTQSLNYRRSLLLVWLSGIALLSVFTVKAVKKGHEIDHIEKTVVLQNEKSTETVDLENLN